MGVPTRRQAERAVRRAVNPLSTALTKVIQKPRKLRTPAGASRRPWQRRLPPDGDDGGAGVREPRRPLPTRPQDAMSLDLPE
jgi:hypothetical protein